MDAPALKKLLTLLPERYIKVNQKSKKARASGITSEILRGQGQIINFLLKTLSELASHYPNGHFGIEPSKYFRSLSAELGEWHLRVLEPGGRRTGGTMTRVLQADALIDDLERMVADMAEALAAHHQFGELSGWRQKWVSK